MVKPTRLCLLVLSSLVPLSGCINLNVGLLPAKEAQTCASCDEDARRADYLDQVRRSGFMATRDAALLSPGEVRSTELK